MAGIFQSIISIQHLAKRYMGRDGIPVQAIDDVSFSVSEGEFVSVVGPSGCGKSTMLKILAGILTKSSGEATLRGTPIEGPRKDVGVVFQSPILLPWRTVMQNVIIPIEIQKLDKRIYESKAREYLKLVGLEGFEHRYPRELSGGMQQRVGICRALVHDPAVLLMDEPFGALDAMTREFMNLELLRIWRESKKTILFVTHSIPEAIFLADRVIVLSSRPAVIHEILTINLPRPREIGIMTSEAFGVYTSRIRHYFNSRGMVDR